MHKNFELKLANWAGLGWITNPFHQTKEHSEKRQLSLSSVAFVRKCSDTNEHEQKRVSFISERNVTRKLSRGGETRTKKKREENTIVEGESNTCTSRLQVSVRMCVCA